MATNHPVGYVVAFKNKLERMAAQLDVERARTARATHGGRRVATHGSSFFERKQRVMCTTDIHNIFLLACPCKKNCIWDCANKVDAFVDEMTDLRAKRFEGNSHVFFSP